MAKVTGQYTKVNKLYGKRESSTVISAAKAVYAGSTPSKRVYANNKIVYDVWDTLLEVSDFTIPESGGYISEYLNIVSKATSISNITEDLSYTVRINGEVVTAIAPNWSSTPKTYNVDITQNDTNISVQVVCTQPAGAHAIYADNEVSSGYGGGEYNITLYSTTNGVKNSDFPIVQEEPGWAFIDWTGWDVDYQTAKVVFNSNYINEFTSTSARSGDIIVKHPHSDDTTAIIRIRQEGYTYTPPSGGDDNTNIVANVNEARRNGYNEISYNVTIVGIENYLDQLVIEVNSSPYGDGTSYVSFTHEVITAGSPWAIGTIYGEFPTSELYLIVRLHEMGEVIGYKVIE